MEEQQPKRGCLLSGALWATLILCILGLLAFTFMLIVKNSSMVNEIPQLTEVSTVAIMIIVTFLIINMIAIVLMLRWKKFGSYLFGIVAIINFLSSVLLNKFDMGTILKDIIVFLISLAIAYFCYKAIDKREKFIKEEI